MGGLKDENRYYGGLMKTVMRKNPQEASRGSEDPEILCHEEDFDRGGNLSLEEDSVGDFNDNDWTPQDSAYGAACPVCGFVPKQVRRLIEFSMIAGMVLGFVYLLVTTSIHITNDRSTSLTTANTTGQSGYHSNQIALDDDRYVEFNQDQIDADDDIVDSANTQYAGDDFQQDGEAGDDLY